MTGWQGEMSLEQVQMVADKHAYLGVVTDEFGREHSYWCVPAWVTSLETKIRRYQCLTRAGKVLS
jgi:hypothetical protein